jgi:type IX secretion system PorP/SprF family membrane protein
MKKQLYTAMLLAGLSGSVSVHAQQDAHFTQYMFNQMYFNPAATGIEQGFRGNLLYRNQWTGYQGLDGPGGAPKNILFTGALPIMEANTGVGIVINNDQIGPLNDLNVSINGAYHYKIGPGKLSAGLSIGLYGRTMKDIYRPNNTSDPVYLDLKNAAGVAEIVPDLGFGLYYSADKFFGGISSRHLNEAKFEYETAKSQMSRHYYIMGGYNIEVNPDIMVTPTFNLKSDSKQTQFELSAMARFNNQFLAGLAYREGDAVSALLGLTALQNKLRITYSIDLTVPATEAKKPTSHEIMASYFVPMVMRGPKPIIRTPRYRK